MSLTRSTFLALLSSFGPVLTQGACAEENRSNFILGTQAIGGRYQFTDKPALIEAAEKVREMGATTMKFALRFDREDAALSAKELVSRDPAYRGLLGMPFTNFLMWVDARAEGAWAKGLSEAQMAEEYRNLHDLAAYLLRTYSGSGKTFYLGHWEGDNMLRGSIAPKDDAKMEDAVRVKGFTDWLATRQRAVDDAKRQTPHHDVQVWHYTEVNHPTISLREGRPSLANKVLPFVPVDFVSYSAYDAQDDPKLLRETLDYLEAQLAPKPGIAGKRVFIGEYGFPLRKDGQVRNTPAQQNERSIKVIRAALEWGCPFVLYWQLYNNELDADGSHRGFWMIDDRGERQPIYDTHGRYYDWARQHTRAFRERTGRQPSDAEFLQAARAYFKQPKILPTK